MRSTQAWIEHLNAARTEIDGLAVDERVRATLRRACAECLVRAEEDALDQYARRNSGMKWSRSDEAELCRILDEYNTKPKTWHEGDSRLTQLSLVLGRGRKQVKAKATELGRGHLVDWYSGAELP